jgi:KDO2-lipid IV(A) lauroyltransferase
MSGDADLPSPPKFSHRLEYAAYRLLESVLGWFPLEVVDATGQALGALAWAGSEKHRRLVTRNLRIATAGWKSPQPDIQALVWKTFLRAGANMLCSLAVGVTNPKTVRHHVHFDGLEHLLGPLRRGQGVTLVWSHMGNWEVLAQLIREVGETVRGGPIYRPLSNPLLDELTVQRRTQEGAVLFNKHDGFFGPANLLKEGGVVTIMGDQRAGGHGEICTFFGKLSSCTPLPSLLARRAKAAMITLSIVETGLARWQLTVRPVPPRSATAEIMHHLEHAMMGGLTDVFWFHDRWRVDRTRPLSFYTRYDPTVAAEATVPCRLLVETPPGQESALTDALLTARADAFLDVVLDEKNPWTTASPRVQIHRRDPNFPATRFFNQIDRSHRAPIDAALLFGSSGELAGVCRKEGIRSIVGCSGAKKPWTRHFPCPSSAEGWGELVAALAEVPTAGK